MPKLLTDPRPRRKPPCGRVIQYHAPHSPFQKLIDGRRAEMGLSYADLAEPLGINRGSVWIWMHNANGFPHPKSCKPEHLQKLAEVLQLDHADVIRALGASRHLFTPRESTPPAREPGCSRHPDLDPGERLAADRARLVGPESGQAAAGRRTRP